jgi:transketolase
MRTTFINTLVEIAKLNPRIVLLTGDMGFLAVEPFAEQFSDRFFNVGVAEQDMVGLATGLAESGFIPFVYSIVPFAVLRPYEFIRNGPIMHQFPVRIVGIGGGMEYGTNGATHYGLEDIGLMRIQPGMTVIVPADYEQARTALQASWNLLGPIYYRLSKDNQTLVPGLLGQFELGRTQRLRTGTDLIMITMGNIANHAIKAAEILAAQGVSCAVLSVASLNPSPTADLEEVLSQYQVAMTIETHYVTGGVGSLVAEVVAESGLNCRVVRCGVKTTPTGITGSQEYMLRIHGLTGDQLAKTAVEALRQTQSR